MAKLLCGDCVCGTDAFLLSNSPISQIYPLTQKGEENRKQNYFMLEEQGGENLL